MLMLLLMSGQEAYVARGDENTTCKFAQVSSTLLS